MTRYAEATWRADGGHGPRGVIEYPLYVRAFKRGGRERLATALHTCDLRRGLWSVWRGCHHGERSISHVRPITTRGASFLTRRGSYRAVTGIWSAVFANTPSSLPRRLACCCWRCCVGGCRGRAVSSRLCVWFSGTLELREHRQQTSSYWGEVGRALHLYMYCGCPRRVAVTK
jgi:hypothetical protein